MKNHIDIFLYKNRLFLTIQKVDPIGIESRKHDLNQECGKYIVPGSNKILSIDGYHKLMEFDFEINIEIDRYPCYVP